VIVIPMLGKSSRFFEAGYSLPKYQLPLGDETVFAKSVRTFESFFESTPFLFLIRSDYGAKNFIADEIVRLGIKDFRIIEFSYDTKGQAESVALGIEDYANKVPLTIFNIDTICLNYRMPEKSISGDGLLDVFESEGEAWSFVEPAILDNKVIRTAEKDRISGLCSNGLYFFKKCEYFRYAYESYVKSGTLVNGEIYIAPLYNHLIEQGYDIRYRVVEKNNIIHCGVPSEYENIKIQYSNSNA